jgi:hypothetical protein
LVALNKDLHCWQSRICNKRTEEPNSRHNPECSKRGKNDQNVALCKRQEHTEPRAAAKLSHLLAMQTIRTIGPVSVNSGESESSHPPL